MKNQNETTVIFKEKEWYRKKIVEMVNQIESVSVLQYLHRFIDLFLEKWG